MFLCVCLPVCLSLCLFVPFIRGARKRPSLTKEPHSAELGSGTCLAFKTKWNFTKVFGNYIICSEGLVITSLGLQLSGFCKGVKLGFES